MMEVGSLFLPAIALVVFGISILHVIHRHGCRLKICRLSTPLLASIYILADPYSTFGVAYGLTLYSIHDSTSKSQVYSTKGFSSQFLDLIAFDEFKTGFQIKVALVLFALSCGYCKGINTFMTVISLTCLLEIVLLNHYIYTTIEDGNLYTCK